MRQSANSRAFRFRPGRSESYFWIINPIVICLVLVVAWEHQFVRSSSAADGFVRHEDSIWEISSRRLSETPELGPIPQFDCYNVAGFRWSASSTNEFLEDVNCSMERRVVFYIHGNWMDQDEARRRATRLYQRLTSSIECEPICFVAFSWPSEKHERIAKDIISKKPRLDADSYYLARIVDMLPTEKKCGFLGYSFGSAVLCGSQHLLNGGTLGKLRLEHSPPRPPARISLIAPAFDRMSLTLHGRYDQALAGTEKLVNLYNSADPILKRFRFFDRETAPAAAGFAGIPEQRLPARFVSKQAVAPAAAADDASALSGNLKIVQYDCRSIGRTHAELDYHESPALARSLENLLGR